METGKYKREVESICYRISNKRDIDDFIEEECIEYESIKTNNLGGRIERRAGPISFFYGDWIIKEGKTYGTKTNENFEKEFKRVSA